MNFIIYIVFLIGSLLLTCSSHIKTINKIEKIRDSNFLSYSEGYKELTSCLTRCGITLIILCVMTLFTSLVLFSKYALK